jgi:hypothetical protein
MSKEKFIVINSKDRNLLLGGQTNSDFTVSYKDNDCQQVLKCVVKDVFIPNQFYNITDDNNKLRVLGGSMGLPEDAVVVAGQYNIDQLISALTIAIDNLLVTDSVVITKNTITNILTFTTTSGLLLSASSSMSPVIGLTSSPSGNVIVMDEPWNLNDLQFVQVHSNAVGSAHGLDASRGIISLIETVSMVETPFGAVAHRQNNDDIISEILYDQPRNMFNIDIRLRDQDGKLLSLPSNHNCTVILKIYFD